MANTPSSKRQLLESQRTPKSSESTRLTLTLPSLKSIRSKASLPQQDYNYDTYNAPTPPSISKRPPRPAKLKPLKEVLTKLIVQIKKKDSYAFFLEPVKVAETPGYSDIVQRPMDLGTMTTKVAKGRYRSLEDFASDVKLVTGNAKAFNPMGTIYYTEAERIEAWALDHISKAASTVIQYETDWNIEIEREDDDQSVNPEENDVDMPDGTGRSQSVSSVPMASSSRRAVRGPQKSTAPKGADNTAAPAPPKYTLDPDGHLPGYRDGVGVFPVDSDWSTAMVALKLKNKRYKTKKERVRFEKYGPPMCADGSLNYTEMQDPFSILSILVPQPPIVRPMMKPYPVPTPHVATEGKSRRCWTVARRHLKQPVGEEPVEVSLLDMTANDFGSFARLQDEIQAELLRRASIVTPAAANGSIANGTGANTPTRGNTVEPITAKIEPADILRHVRDSLKIDDATAGYTGGFWTPRDAILAEQSLRDFVYGGIEGYAYVRSLAEFVTAKPEYLANEPGDPDCHLGLPLAEWVAQYIVDPLTEGRHGILRHTVRELESMSRHSLTQEPISPLSAAIKQQLQHSLLTYPSAARALAELLQTSRDKIDMGALLLAPQELFLSEEEWAGTEWKRTQKESDLGYRMLWERWAEACRVVRAQIAAAEKNKGSEDGKEVTMPVIPPEPKVQETKEMLVHVLNYTAKLLDEIMKRGDAKDGKEETPEDEAMKYVKMEEFEDRMDEDSVDATDDHSDEAKMRNLRLNLLALAKRAPLDSLAKVSKDLVPERIRAFVPTLD